MRTDNHECGSKCQHSQVQCFACVVLACMKLRQENPKSSLLGLSSKILRAKAVKDKVPAWCWRAAGADCVKWPDNPLELCEGLLSWDWSEGGGFHVKRLRNSSQMAPPGQGPGSVCVSGTQWMINRRDQRHGTVTPYMALQPLCKVKCLPFAQELLGSHWRAWTRAWLELGMFSGKKVWESCKWEKGKSLVFSGCQ